MFTFETMIDLPLIWGGIIATAVLLYVLLDGFDLGVGILFPFAPSHRCRDKMMNSIAPFWDGNETWLVLGGGGMLAAFPLAYAIIMPAFYIPVIAMLLCLIFRGVAFEFRFKADRSRFLWDYAFHFGSLGAGFFQGVILGGYIQGVEVSGRAFAGGAFDWLSAFSLTCGLGLMCGYMLLGATWLIMKTDDETQQWARNCARYIMLFIAIFMGIISLWTPFLEVSSYMKWFTLPNFYYLMPLPLTTLAVYALLWRALRRSDEYKPFFLSLGLFFLCYLGLAISLWPWIVPYAVSLRDAAAAGTSLSLLLIGVVILLPVILAYTAFSYYTFRGKTSHDHTY